MNRLFWESFQTYILLAQAINNSVKLSRFQGVSLKYSANFQSKHCKYDTKFELN